jgi:allophanate hydrolase subunit 2
VVNQKENEMSLSDKFKKAVMWVWDPNKNNKGFAVTAGVQSAFSIGYFLVTGGLTLPIALGSIAFWFGSEFGMLALSRKFQSDFAKAAAKKDAAPEAPKATNTHKPSGPAV